jgi:Carboxypeptidase regulatory-like domain
MNNRMPIFLTTAVVLALAALSAPGAQPTPPKGTLHGIVTDASGAAVPRASVIVSAGRMDQTVSTDESGQYTVSGLVPGHYRVQIKSPGFSQFDKSGLLLSAGYETEADAQLVVSAVKQEITVNAGELE